MGTSLLEMFSWFLEEGRGGARSHSPSRYFGTIRNHSDTVEESGSSECKALQFHKFCGIKIWHTYRFEQRVNKVT